MHAVHVRLANFHIVMSMRCLSKLCRASWAALFSIMSMCKLYIHVCQLCWGLLCAVSSMLSCPCFVYISSADSHKLHSFLLCLCWHYLWIMLTQASCTQSCLLCDSLSCLYWLHVSREVGLILLIYILDCLCLVANISPRVYRVILSLLKPTYVACH